MPAEVPGLEGDSRSGLDGLCNARLLDQRKLLLRVVENEQPHGPHTLRSIRLVADVEKESAVESDSPGISSPGSNQQ